VLVYRWPDCGARPPPATMRLRRRSGAQTRHKALPRSRWRRQDKIVRRFCNRQWTAWPFGAPVLGCFTGVILTDAGPKLLEFNCRFGDPGRRSSYRCSKPICWILLACAEGQAGWMFAGDPVRNRGDGVAGLSRMYPRACPSWGEGCPALTTWWSFTQGRCRGTVCWLQMGRVLDGDGQGSPSALKTPTPGQCIHFEARTTDVT
jgi:hypothetical protein